MYRHVAQFPILALSLLPFAAGCGRSDRLKTTASSEGAAPIVSASSPVVEGNEPGEITNVSYEAAESTFGSRHYPEAVQMFTAYTGTHSDNPWGYYMLGMSEWKAGNGEKALEAFDHALQLDPEHRKSLFNSSRVLLDGGQPKDALVRIQKALELDPMSNEGLRLLGRTRYELGDVQEAVRAYHRALTVDDRDVWSMNNLGLIYIQQGRSQEAIAPLARAVELRDNSPVFQNNLGTALERAGYPTAAAQAYERAIAVDSTYAKASVGLARVTGGGQQPESLAVDLTKLSTEFQTQIEGWRGTAGTADSIGLQVGVASDSGVQDSIRDSVLISGGEVSDTLEECEGQEDR
jgi:tetratricopeptide (TPR) repeat protein